MTDYSDVIGRSFTFAVFSDNRKLAKKIIDRACELQSFDILYMDILIFEKGFKMITQAPIFEEQAGISYRYT